MYNINYPALGFLLAFGILIILNVYEIFFKKGENMTDEQLMYKFIWLTRRQARMRVLNDLERKKS